MPNRAFRYAPGIPLRVDISVYEGVARLKRHQVVRGLVLIGSAWGQRNQRYSDYDIVVMLKEKVADVAHFFAYFNGQPVDIVIVEEAVVWRLIRSPHVIYPDYWAGGGLFRWLREGKITYDPAGLLGAARQRLSLAPDGPIPDDGSIHSVRFLAYYELEQIRLKMGSGDPAHIVLNSLRINAAIDRICQSYFVVRKLPWQGMKDALHHLIKHDPVYFALLDRCLAEVDALSKFARLNELASATFARLDDRWLRCPVGVDHSISGVLSGDTIAAGLRFWNSLFDPSLTEAGFGASSRSEVSDAAGV